MNSPTSRSLAVSLTLLLGLVCMAPSRALPPPTLLADKPIAAGADVPGNMALALSVEFPTAISIANLGDYSDTTQYIGYFDAAKCYLYRYNTVTPASSHFRPNSVAATGGGGHDCSGTAGQWSGNFLNWATMQTIDPFRWALTGGYRSVDTSFQTVLEKAWGSQQGSAPANFPYRGTSQGAGNTLSTSGSSIAKLTPFNNWNQLNMGIWGNGNTMVISGGSGYTTLTTDPSVTDLTDDLSVSNTSAGQNGAYRVYIRVSVCVNGMLEANCVQYGSHYKPEGLLQQYSQKIRFSAFGYLNQGGDVREGGAMRGPMGFIGPNIPQPFSSTPLANPAPEWDGTTGIMSVNPDTASASAPNPTVPQSGVMNYLNKFGEYAAVNGGQVYKTYDNVGELYYAAVRYFENLGNVTEWSNNTTPAILDGFPAVLTWPTDTDTTVTPNPHGSILYSCQKNFILGIGDDHTWYDYDVGGSTYSGPGARPMPGGVSSDTFNQASAWTTALQQVEGITQTPVWPFDSGATYFIAGLAYGVHVNDIRPDLSGAQTISTYWMDVAEGQHLEDMNPYYLAAKYGGFNAGTIPQGPAGFTNPGPPITVNPAAYNMLTPIAVNQFDTTTNACSGPSFPACVNMNGNLHPLPDNYYNAGSATAMVAGLKSAFTSISSSISQLSTSFSFSLPNVTSGTGTQSFGASFDANGWVGTVIGYTLTFDTLGNPVQAPAWCTSICTPAAPLMNTLQTQLTQLGGTGWQTKRYVATWNDGSHVGVPFQFASLSTAEQSALQPGFYSSGTPSTDESKYLDYLRGDQSNEVGSTVSGSIKAFRARKLLLGDIVDAQLTPVSTPQQTFSEANNPGYPAFQLAMAARPTMVYAGANDGMLHAFDGTTGLEQFAYVPSGLFYGPNGTPQVDGLAQLGNPNYIHHYYVDATPASFEIDFAHTGLPPYTAPNDWHTVLIGGLGKGGKSFYALDITDPAPSGGMTEAVLKDKVLWEFTDLTMGYSYGTPVVVKTAKYGWVVVLTSGYNNPDGFGYLYIVNPKTGALLEKIQTPSLSNGMTQASAFVKDFSDETADSVYVGDLQGQVWRFDLTGTPTTYPAPTLLATVTDGGMPAKPQPITTAPLIEIHPVTRQRYVMFGTGQLLALPDVNNSQMQSFYAIIDGTASGFPAVSTPITRANLTPVTNTQISGAAGAPPTPPKANSLLAGTKGWYIDLGIDAPSNVSWRVILNPQAFNGIVTFATSLTTATDPCSPQGSSRVYAIDYATVDSVLEPNVSGSPVPPFDQYTVSAINLRFAGANGSPEIVVGFTSGVPEKVPAILTSTLATRILNWREIPTVE